MFLTGPQIKDFGFLTVRFSLLKVQVRIQDQISGDLDQILIPRNSYESDHSRTTRRHHDNAHSAQWKRGVERPLVATAENKSSRSESTHE